MVFSFERQRRRSDNERHDCQPLECESGEKKHLAHMIPKPPVFNLTQPPNPLDILNSGFDGQMDSRDKFFMFYLNQVSADVRDKCNNFKIQLLAGVSNDQFIVKSPHSHQSSGAGSGYNYIRSKIVSPNDYSGPAISRNDSSTVLLTKTDSRSMGATFSSNSNLFSSFLYSFSILFVLFIFLFFIYLYYSRNKRTTSRRREPTAKGMLSSESTFLSSNHNSNHLNKSHLDNLPHHDAHQYQHLLINENGLDSHSSQIYNLISTPHHHQLDHQLQLHLLQVQGASPAAASGPHECHNYLIKGLNNQNILIKAANNPSNYNNNNLLNIISTAVNSSNSPSTSSSASSATTASSFQPGSTTTPIYNSFRVAETHKLTNKHKSRNGSSKECEPKTETLNKKCLCIKGNPSSASSSSSNCSGSNSASILIHHHPGAHTVQRQPSSASYYTSTLLKGSHPTATIIHQGNYESNPVAYNKVAALICEQGLVDLPGPQLIKIVSIPAAPGGPFCYQQATMDTFDANEHYANGFLHEGLQVPPNPPPRAPQNDDDEQFYEMIDEDSYSNNPGVDANAAVGVESAPARENIPHSSHTSSLMAQRLFTADNSSSSSSSLLLKKKYPKTNPNYVKVSTLAKKASIDNN